MPKPRADAVLKNMDREQQDQIFDWLKKLGYSKTISLTSKEYGVKTSLGALHNFYEWKISEDQKDRVFRALSATDEILQDADVYLPRLKEASRAKLQEAALNAMLAGNDDQTKLFFDVLLKLKAEDTRAEQAQLARSRFEFDAARAVLQNLDALKAIRDDSKKTTDEQLDSIRRQLFSVLPEGD